MNLAPFSQYSGEFCQRSSAGATNVLLQSRKADSRHTQAVNLPTYRDLYL